MKKGLFLAILLAMSLALIACDRTTPVEPLIVQDVSFTIRITGSVKVLNPQFVQRNIEGRQKVDQRNSEAEAKYNRLLDESLINEEKEMEEISGLKYSFEEYCQRLHEISNRYTAERDRGYEEYLAVLETPEENLYPAWSGDEYLDNPCVSFSGSYMVVSSGGASTSRSVSGITPTEYYIGNAAIVSCAFQKSGEKGLLTVEILKGGKVVVSEYTTATYGIVSVVTY